MVRYFFWIRRMKKFPYSPTRDALFYHTPPDEIARPFDELVTTDRTEVLGKPRADQLASELLSVLKAEGFRRHVQIDPRPD